MRFVLSALKSLLTSLRGIGCKRKQRAMRLCETLPLGDRRYLALVEVEGQKFLLGAAGSSLSLLARLPALAETLEPLSGAEPDAMFDAEEYKKWR
jgi:flagellar biogenesis protein FliO